MDVLLIPHRIDTLDGQRVVLLDGKLKRDVAGEEFRQEHISKIAAWVRANPQIKLIAYLVPEPTNAHDPNAVQIWVCGGLVGYMPRFFAQLWQAPITEMRARFQAQVTCPVEIELPEPNDWTSGDAIQVSLWLPWLDDGTGPTSRGPSTPRPKVKRTGVKIAVDQLVFSLQCMACKRLNRLTFEELRTLTKCRCPCGVPVPYEPADIKAAVDELKDMSTLLKIETKRA